MCHEMQPTTCSEEAMYIIMWHLEIYFRKSFVFNGKIQHVTVQRRRKKGQKKVLAKHTYISPFGGNNAPR